MSKCHPAAPLSAYAPLRNPTFRLLWFMWLIANLCIWMNSVATAWRMTAMAHSPLWVALVQTAATLPVFLLGLPTGALADMLDRRHCLIATQLWVALVATLLCMAAIAGVMSPAILLALTFANGMGLAMRWPVYAALIPEVVSRSELPAALALNGIALNASRIAGPLLAGVFITTLGDVYVFALTAVLSLVSAVFIIGWRRGDAIPPPPREPLLGAIGRGVTFLRQSAELQAAVVHVAVFFFYSTALMALLPLVAARAGSDGARTFTILLAMMGAGAIVMAMNLPRLRRALTDRQQVLSGTVIQSASIIVVSTSHSVYTLGVAMLVSGAAWTIVANSLNVTLQLALSDWVRARATAMYQMSMMGASAAGAAVWGQLASVAGVSTCLQIAACCGLLMTVYAHRKPESHGPG